MQPSNQSRVLGGALSSLGAKLKTCTSFLLGSFGPQGCPPSPLLGPLSRVSIQFIGPPPNRQAWWLMDYLESSEAYVWLFEVLKKRSVLWLVMAAMANNTT